MGITAFFNIISDGSTELTCLLLAMQKERGSNKSKVMCCYFVFFCQLLSQVHLFSFPCCVSGLILIIWKQITYGYCCYCFREFLLWGEVWLIPSDSDLQTLLRLFLRRLQNIAKRADILPVSSTIWYQGICLPYQKKLKNLEAKKKIWNIAFVFEFTEGRSAWNWSWEQNHFSKACWDNWIYSKDFNFKTT